MIFHRSLVVIVMLSLVASTLCLGDSQAAPDAARVPEGRGDAQKSVESRSPRTKKPTDEPISVGESALEKGVSFSAVAQRRWVTPAPGEKTEVVLGLKVTNRTGLAMQLNVFDTVTLVLTDSDGVGLACTKERDATSIPDPMIIAEKTSATVKFNATLHWSEDGSKLLLDGPDGAGGRWNLEVKAGSYLVHFSYENTQEKLNPVTGRDVKHVVDPKSAPFWMGKAVTPNVALEIVAHSSNRVGE